ncbi:MAG: SDR family oxidoreductase [Mycobacteriales bacterium]
MTRDIVVTGGGTGIGRAIAAAFAAQGDRVVITGRRKDVLADAAAGIGARAVPFDASDPAQVSAALADLPERVDVLVNNAGGNTDLGGDPADGTLAGVAEAWLANYRANMISAVLVTTALTDRLARGGTVVNLGSIAAETGAGSYGAAKAAVAAWNSELATSLGERGVTCNVIAPGLITDTEFFHGKLSDERRGVLIGRTATGRAGTPDDTAALALFLASPGARHLTGQVFHLNGGAHRTR